MSENSLTNALISAGDGSKTEIEDFFKTLLNSKIFIPVKPKSPSPNPVLGETKPEQSPYLFITYEEHSCIPIFSEESFVLNWSEKQITSIDEDFKTFIWRIPENTWLYLNPNQDVGKEISPWEIELFKQGGEDAVSDLVEGVIETEQEDIEIEPPPEELIPLTKALIPVLEIYSELKEAYLLSIRETGSNSPRALIGIKYDSILDENRSTYIRSEIERTAEEHLVRPFNGVFIVDDLGIPESLNQNLFLDIAPFYKK